MVSAYRESYMMKSALLPWDMASYDEKDHVLYPSTPNEIVTVTLFFLVARFASDPCTSK